MLRAFLGSLLLLPVLALSASAEDAAFAAGDFVTAEHDYEAALAANPNDPDALAGLARIRLYEGRIKEARDLAAKAPGNPVSAKVIATADMRGAAFAPDVWRTAMPKHGVTIKFTATDPLPMLSVKIGKQEVTFLIDTGAPDLVLDRDFAAEIGLKSAEAGQGTFAGGQHAAVAKSTLPEIALGALRVTNVPVTLLPTRGFALKPGVRIDGVIGTGFLRHFLATIDYVHGALVLKPRDESAAFEKSAVHATVVPMWLTGDHFLFARAHIGDAPEALYNIDTGLAGGGVQATKATLDAAHIVPDESHAQMSMGGGGMVKVVPFRADATLGWLTVKDVEGSYTPDGDQFGIFPFKVAGTLSHGFFRQHALTFDFVAMKLVVQ